MLRAGSEWVQEPHMMESDFYPVILSARSKCCCIQISAAPTALFCGGCGIAEATPWYEATVSPQRIKLDLSVILAAAQEGLLHPKPEFLRLDGWL
jgi:hypothetical protein